MSAVNPTTTLPLWLTTGDFYVEHPDGSRTRHLIHEQLERTTPVASGLVTTRCAGGLHVWASTGNVPIPDGTPCDCGLTLRCDLSAFRLTPSEKGEAGASDAAKHLREEAPGWLLEALGDALQAQHGREFTSETIRAAAGPTVNAWLDVKGRENCFPGWWRARRKRFKLVRVARPPAVAQRASRRGAVLPFWRFP